MSAYSASPTGTALRQRRPARPISSARRDVSPIRAAAGVSPTAMRRPANAWSAAARATAAILRSPFATAATACSARTLHRARRAHRFALTAAAPRVATIPTVRAPRRAARAALAAPEARQRGGGRRDLRGGWGGWRELSAFCSLCLFQQSAHRHSTMNVPSSAGRRERRQPNFGLISV